MTEKTELAALDVESPLCGKGDGGPLSPCPFRDDTELGLLLAKKGRCIWSPLLGIPSKSGYRRTFIFKIRCSANDIGWDRIQRTALPRH